jgi:hypothetical protein
MTIKINDRKMIIKQSKKQLKKNLNLPLGGRFDRAHTNFKK